MGERKKIKRFEDLETGEELLVSPKHGDYGMLVEKNLLDKISINSLGEKTFTCESSFSFLSPEKISQFKARAKARYGTSFGCFSNICFAFGTNSPNSSAGIISISSFKNPNISAISSLDNLVFNSNLSILLPSSKNTNSGATKSKNLYILLIANTSYAKLLEYNRLVAN